MTEDKEKKAESPRQEDEISRALASSLDLYLMEINRFPLLTRDEEAYLAKKYWETGDPRAAHKLVTSNLRFVVKVAMQYSKYGVKLKDLIQEGNIGLMVAVKRFNPELGYRVISYAVWWIRAYIQKSILESWSIVKMGTTQAQRKLFNSLRRTQSRIRSMSGEEATVGELAKELDVREKDVEEMISRMAGKDLSLNAPIDGDQGPARLDLLPSPLQSPEIAVERASDQQTVSSVLERLGPSLNEREKVVLRERLLSDEPMSLREIGEKYSISRERVRQIEERLKKKIKSALEKDGIVDWVEADIAD